MRIKPFIFFICLSPFFLIVFFSCSKPKTSSLTFQSPSYLKTILVLPWDIYPFKSESFFYSPVTGVLPGPIESYVQENMYELLKKELSNLKTSYQFIFLSATEYETLIGEILEETKKPEEIIRTLALKTRTDGILYGKIYRFKERKGRGFAVEEPASVAFVLLLYDGHTGKLIWYDLFDETQKPLSENLLNFSLYGKIKWLTVQELAERGLNKIFKTFPK